MSRTRSRGIVGSVLVPVLASLALLATACERDSTAGGAPSTGSDTTLVDGGSGATRGPVFSFPAGEPVGGEAGDAPSPTTGSGDSLIRVVGDVIAAEAIDVPEAEATEVRTGLVVGDSLTVSADDQIRAALAAEGLVVVDVDAAEGRRIARGPVEPGDDAVLRLRIAGADPDLWVVALGTNDVGAQADDETMRADVAEILRLLPLDAEVLWIDTRVEGRAEGSVAANVLLRRIAAFDPRVEVVDWHTIAGEDGMLVDDGVHLTPAGKTRFAAAIADAVGDHYDIAPLPAATR